MGELTSETWASIANNVLFQKIFLNWFGLSRREMKSGKFGAINIS